MYLTIYEIVALMLMYELYDEDTILDIFKNNSENIIMNKYFYLGAVDNP
jgi:hypothetical protein